MHGQSCVPLFGSRTPLEWPCLKRPIVPRLVRGETHKITQKAEVMGGVMSEFLGLGMERQNRKTKQFNMVEMKVRMDCEGCELKVRNTLATMRGVESVDINRKQQKVTVKGFVETQRVLRRIQATKKRVELWPYVPYTNPYVVPPVYDKRAPAGHVRRVDVVVPASGDGPGQEERLATLFSDDNPNACSFM